MRKADGFPIQLLNRASCATASCSSSRSGRRNAPRSFPSCCTVRPDRARRRSRRRSRSRPSSRSSSSSAPRTWSASPRPKRSSTCTRSLATLTRVRSASLSSTASSASSVSARFGVSSDRAGLADCGRTDRLGPDRSAIFERRPAGTHGPPQQASAQGGSLCLTVLSTELVY